MHVPDVIQSWWVRGGLLAAALCVGTGAAWSLRHEPPTQVEPFEKLFAAQVKRVLSGHTVKIEPDLKLSYAGIRAPYADEPFFGQAKNRNEKLVSEKRVRVRYDDEAQGDDERGMGYVFADGVFVNEQLVREGLAYVRLTTGTNRYNDRLLAAQAEAWRRRRGIWGRPAPRPEKTYFADPKYGNFHRPDCEETPKIKPERLRTFKTRGSALGKGFAPCRRCNP
jgi:micrococcal nuclease